MQALDLADLREWRNGLGLLPVPLFATNEADRYVLLNGVFGNFCLDLKGESDWDRPRKYAWSVDVGHYVNLVGDRVEVSTWGLRATSVERFSARSVQDKLGAFHEYLIQHQPNRSLSVVAFALNIFRRLRALLLQQGIEGPPALKVFLYLIACATDKKDVDDLDIESWRLGSEIKAMSQMIRSGDWQALVEALLFGVPDYSLTPDLPLLIRHASGQLFQEAHYIARLRSRQMTLEGILPTLPVIEKVTENVGIHYTPSSIARLLVEQALRVIGVKWPTLTVFDPACGSGEFLKEAVRQLRLRGYSGRLRVIGWDLSQVAVDITRFLLGRECVDYPGAIEVQIECLDATTATWPNDIDILFMNPPFLSWEAMDSEQKEKVRSTLGSMFERRPDLAAVFIYNAARALRNNGIVSIIIPASILDAESYRKFRREVSTLLCPLFIGKMGSQVVFQGAIVDSALYVGIKKPRPEIWAPVAMWADHRFNSVFSAIRALRRHYYLTAEDPVLLEGEGYSIYSDSRIGSTEKSWTPHSHRSFTLFQEVKSLPKAGHLFDIRQGALTGFNPAFLISRGAMRNLPSREQKFFRPAVINQSISNGHLKDVAYVFYSEGQDVPAKIENEENLKSLLPTYYDTFLLPNQEKLARRAGTSDERWWELTRPRTWQYTHMPKLVSTYFGKAGSWAWDGEGKYAVVQGYAWIAKDLDQFTEDVGLAYLALLNSPMINELLSYISNHVGGGQWNLSKRYVDNLPLPALLQPMEIAIFARLRSFGQLLSQGTEYDKKALAEVALLAYGLPESLLAFE